MYTNMPSIGSLIREIDVKIRNLRKQTDFLSRFKC